MTTETILQAIRRIEAHSRRDPGKRGLAEHAPRDLLAPAAEALIDARRTIVVTGFPVRPGPVGETDGPPGALALADALRQLGGEVILLTDACSAPLIAAGRRAGAGAIPVELLAAPQSAADAAIDRLLAEFAPTHAVAVERPGNAADGHRYSMRGEILDAIAPSADRIFAPPGARRHATLAIGDGGNELGFGALRQSLAHRIERGATIFSATPADHALPAGISNWGAYALAAALSLLARRRLIRPPAEERRILEAIVAAGALDGRTKRPALSVDGLAWDEYAETLEAIFGEVCAGVECRGKGET
ncbi:MAG: DUF4392 domain-containing protein [Candidatus Accumulibacter sp.]|jgi:hypothetical protein|nr:DUF4392 domain-containing protein [Accumulibacter sp.]